MYSEIVFVLWGSRLPFHLQFSAAASRQPASSHLNGLPTPVQICAILLWRDMEFILTQIGTLSPPTLHAIRRSKQAPGLSLVLHGIVRCANPTSKNELTSHPVTVHVAGFVVANVDQDLDHGRSSLVTPVCQY